MRQVPHLVTLAAAALVGSTMIAGTADAQTPGGYYVAVPAAPPAKASIMTRATPWTLKGDRYVAARAPERDGVLCQLVAKNTGQLAAFTVAGTPYDADQLARCNARAKGGPSATASVAAR